MNEINSTLIRSLLTTTSSMITTNNIQADDSDMEYFHPKFPRFITIVFLIIGNFGNILSLVIFLSKSMRNNSVFTYFAFLSIVDFFVITFGLGDAILLSYFKFVIRNESIILCRLHTFLTYVFAHLSSFILASVSIDRAIALNSINLSRIYCKTQTAYKVILINIIVVVLINCHSLFFLGTYEYADENVGSLSNNSSITFPNSDTSKMILICGTKEGTLYKNFLEPYFEYIDLLCYAILPFLVMFICTILIIKVMVTSNKKFVGAKSLSSVSKSSSKNEENAGPTERMLKFRQDRMRKKIKRTKHITYTLLILNVLFLCLVSPLVLVIALSNSDSSENKILLNTVTILAYSNHCFNFIFYGLSCSSYRTAIMTLFGIKKGNLNS
jgi:hypothetical protein